MVGSWSFATQIGWHFMYKDAVMQWQNTSKTHTFLSLHRTCLIGGFWAKQTVQSTISEYHFQKHSLFFREKPRKSVKSSAWALASKIFFLT